MCNIAYPIYETETMDKLYLELSQFVNAKTKKDTALEKIFGIVLPLNPDDMTNAEMEIFEIANQALE